MVLKRLTTLITKAFDFIAGKPELDIKPVTPVKKRTYDKTPLTQEQIQYIIAVRANVVRVNQLSGNPDEYITQDATTKKLNDELGLNKSTTTYRNIWNQSGEQSGE